MMDKRPQLERHRIVTFNEDGHHFVNLSKLTMLNTGAIRQLGERFVEHEQRFGELVAENARLQAALARLENKGV